MKKSSCRARRKARMTARRILNQHLSGAPDDNRNQDEKQQIVLLILRRQVEDQGSN
jgi:hypothetical protein